MLRHDICAALFDCRGRSRDRAIARRPRQSRVPAHGTSVPPWWLSDFTYAPSPGASLNPLMVACRRALAVASVLAGCQPQARQAPASGRTGCGSVGSPVGA